MTASHRLTVSLQLRKLEADQSAQRRQLIRSRSISSVASSWSQLPVDSRSVQLSSTADHSMPALSFALRLTRLILERVTERANQLMMRVAAAAEGRRGSKEADGGSAAADQISSASSLSRRATVSDSSKEGGTVTVTLLLERRRSASMAVKGGRRAWSCTVRLRLNEPAQRSATAATVTVTASIDPRCRRLWKYSAVRSTTHSDVASSLPLHAVEPHPVIRSSPAPLSPPAALPATRLRALPTVAMRVLVAALAALLLVAAVNPAMGAVDADAQLDESPSLPPSSLVGRSDQLSAAQRAGSPARSSSAIVPSSFS